MTSDDVMMLARLIEECAGRLFWRIDLMGESVEGGGSTMFARTLEQAGLEPRSIALTAYDDLENTFTITMHIPTSLRVKVCGRDCIRVIGATGLLQEAINRRFRLVKRLLWHSTPLPMRVAAMMLAPMAWMATMGATTPDTGSVVDSVIRIVLPCITCASIWALLSRLCPVRPSLLLQRRDSQPQFWYQHPRVQAMTTMAALGSGIWAVLQIGNFISGIIGR